MTAYRVRWVESWSRSMTVNLDEDSLRSWADTPVGPISESLVKTYLEESAGAGMEEWHPKTTPGVSRDDDFEGLDVTSIEPAESV